MSDATQEQASAAVASVPGWGQSRVEVRPIVGGLSNSNWLVRREGRDYFLNGQRQSGWPVKRHSSWPVGRG
jgi:hypothetical protein